MTFDSIENYSLICGASYHLLNSVLVHRAETMVRLVPVFVGAVKRILAYVPCNTITHLLACTVRLNSSVVLHTSRLGVERGVERRLRDFDSPLIQFNSTPRELT